MNTLDTTPLPFGKYKGQTPEDIADFHPSYIVWLYDTVAPKRCSKALALACEADERDEDEEHMYGLGPADHLAPTCQERVGAFFSCPSRAQGEAHVRGLQLQPTSHTGRHHD